ncbi:hypothetical protein M8J76_013210 [Diaphorina citri]|nr:hypothetical protein M8J76_013210 [Diaphorina citri]
MATLLSLTFVALLLVVAQVVKGDFDFHKCNGVKPCETPSNPATGLWYLSWASRAGEKNRKSFFKNNNCGIFKNCNDCGCLATYYASGDENLYVGYTMASNTHKNETYVKSFYSQKVTDNKLVYYKANVDYEATLRYSDKGYPRGTDYESKTVGDFYKYTLLDTDDNKSYRIHLICEDTNDICENSQPLILLYTKSKNPGKEATMKNVLDVLGRNGLNAHDLALTYYDNNGCKWPELDDFNSCNWGCGCMKVPKNLAKHH